VTASPATAAELARLRRLTDPPASPCGAVLLLLRATPGGDTAAGLAARLDLSTTTIQGMLRPLLLAGLVERQGKDGYAPVYRATPR